MKKYDLVALGEALIDFTPAGISEHGFPQYGQNPGGAVLNVAAVLGKYGKRSCLIAKTGKDIFGAFLREQLSLLGVDISHMVEDEAHDTTLAFVSLKPDGERDFAFYRKNNADVYLTVGDLSREALSDCRVFDFGGLSFVNETYAEATLEAISIAKKSGAAIAYDPNYRPTLWSSEKEAREMMLLPMKHVDMIKISDDEAEFLFGESDTDRMLDILLGKGIKTVTVTGGSRGAWFATEKTRGFVPALTVKTLDATGAGDVFWGTFITNILETSPDPSDKDAVAACVASANKAAGLSTTKKGAVPSIPEYKDIKII